MAAVNAKGRGPWSKPTATVFLTRSEAKPSLGRSTLHGHGSAAHRIHEVHKQGNMTTAGKTGPVVTLVDHESKVLVEGVQGYELDVGFAEAVRALSLPGSHAVISGVGGPLESQSFRGSSADRQERPRDGVSRGGSWRPERPAPPRRLSPQRYACCFSGSASAS
eukprot:scaffold277_cov261-Pinguiococcus_pyrenoidosus.AAC.10